MCTQPHSLLEFQNKKHSALLMKMDNYEVVVSYTVVERDREHSSIDMLMDLLELCFWHIVFWAQYLFF